MNGREREIFLPWPPSQGEVPVVNKSSELLIDRNEGKMARIEENAI